MSSLESHIPAIERQTPQTDATGSRNLQFAQVVGSDGWRPIKQGSDSARDENGRSTIAKSGIPDGKTLLADIGGNAQAKLPLTTGMDGRACASQPKGNEVPTLKVGQTNSCDYADNADLKKRFDAASQHSASVNVPMKSDSPLTSHGSGLIIGKQNGKCMGLTDYHVAHVDNMDSKLDKISVQMPNGKTYPAELRSETPGKDMSMFAVITGADTDAACHPATIAEDGGAVKFADMTLGVGYPDRSQSPTAHPGMVIKVAPLDQVGPPLVKGEDMKRPTAVEIANVQQGDSGGGVFNLNGEAVGLMDRSDGGKIAGVTPITRAEVQDMIKRSRH
jgi:S1-C subfamily serine protease